MSAAPTVPTIDRRAGVQSALEECVTTFQRHLHLPDPGAVLVTLAAIAANRAEGDPVWLLLVGPPGGGKTEVLGATVGLSDVYPASTITEAALLSGTPKKETASGAKGGLLRQIGPFGIIVYKDFGSVLSMNRDARASVLAALREVYDGSWTRHVGTDGGLTLAWAGKIGLIAGCTPAIDSHHAVMGSMGERFVLFRLPPVDGDAQVARALAHLGTERKMRTEMAASVASVLECVDPGDLAIPPTDELRSWLISISTLAVRCRSSVERDSHTREVELIPEPEAPARLALVLLRLYNGLRAIGVDEAQARRLAGKVALDSMPQIRRKVLDVVVVEKEPIQTAMAAERLEYPTVTVRRACEDLTAHGLLTRHRGKGSKGDTWSITDWALARWPTVPEMSVGESNGANSVPETSGGECLEGNTFPSSLSLCIDDDKTGTQTCFACGEVTTVKAAGGEAWCLDCQTADMSTS
jgi:hypothetical protein